ncbi:ABC transporter ATP-binding protein [Streptomyces sp. TRM72054]|uniref:ABC transporter ATP-binding protein n=1 Tax=Streptomyces sp. TRM72054 TaxID=2870562 RepID=UPI0021AB6E99|nr:ABC transporter ATP-binding protein [Streptomyces sp. TRM72054]
MTTAAGASLAPLVRTSGVCKAYRSAAETVWAARDVDFTARAGEFVCVYGASGSGKSTLLNLLAGLDLADSGEIRVGGVDVGTADEAQRAELRLRTVGVVFQEHNLIEEFTAVENVALPLEARGVPVAEAREQALEQLSRVGLADLAERLPWQLSGGQRQRVGVARALTGQRAVLLADEPTGALDSVATQELFELIRKLCDDGVLAVVCSHDPRCRDFADTVYEVIDGRLESRS